MKTILLHVGTHKTGSTSLQRTFYQQRDVLRQQGICYLGGDGAYPDLYSAFMSAPMNFEWNVLSGLSEEQIRDRDRAALEDLGRQIAASPCETIVISSEYLSMLSHDEQSNLKMFLERHGRVIAIYFYRELLSWMSSDSQQLAKAGLRRRPTTYETAVERICEMPLRVCDVFGRENTRFIRFEDAVKTGICNAFLSCMGLPTLADQGISEVHANESISANAVRAMFLYNRLFPRGGGQRQSDVVDRLHMLEGPKYVLAGITSEQIADYAARRAEIVDKLGLVLQAPEDIPVSDTLDPVTDELLRMINRYERLRQEGD